MTEQEVKIFFAALKHAKLPIPEREIVFAGEIGRKWRFDFGFPEQKVAVEQEGGVYTKQAHGSITGLLRDLEKYSWAAALGWRVIRRTPAQLPMPETMQMLKRALG